MAFSGTPAGGWGPVTVSTFAGGDQVHADVARCAYDFLHFSQDFLEVGPLLISLSLQKCRDANGQRELSLRRPFLQWKPRRIKRVVESPDCHRIAAMRLRF